MTAATRVVLGAALLGLTVAGAAAQSGGVLDPSRATAPLAHHSQPNPEHGGSDCKTITVQCQPCPSAAAPRSTAAIDSACGAATANESAGAESPERQLVQWWLTAVGIFLTTLALVMPITGFLAYSVAKDRFNQIKQEVTDEAKTAKEELEKARVDTRSMLRDLKTELEATTTAARTATGDLAAQNAEAGRRNQDLAKTAGAAGQTREELNSATSAAREAADALETATRNATHVQDALPQVADEARQATSDLVGAIRDARNAQTALEIATRNAEAAAGNLPPEGNGGAGASDTAGGGNGE